MSNKTELNIYQRINAVMNDCEYIQKQRAQQGQGVMYDEVMAMIRELLVKHGIVMVMRQQSFSLSNDVEGTKQKIFQGAYEMDLVNIDKPEEKVTHSCFAQGMDGGDKAAGKAHTYAAKIMLVKGFGIETGINEESRSERIDKANKINQEQYSELANFCLTEQNGQTVLTQIGVKLVGNYGISLLSDLPASKFDEALARCKKAVEKAVGNA